MSTTKRVRLAEQLVWTIDPIVAESLSAQTVPCLIALVGLIHDRKALSGILHHVEKKYPLKDCAEAQHLKRIRRNRDGSFHVFICYKDNSNEPLADIPDAGLFDNTLTVNVPSGPLKTRAQYDFANTVWPCKFHEDRHLEGLLHREWEDVWGGAAKDEHISRIKNLGSNSAILIDPKNQECVVKAESTTSLFLEKHVVMVLISNLAKTQCTSFGKDEEDREYYLCTGLDLYIEREPCFMCCMALVHSRIRRVFFSLKTNDGGLSGTTKIHVMKALNHSFQVFHVHENKGDT